MQEIEFFEHFLVLGYTNIESNIIFNP